MGALLNMIPFLVGTHPLIEDGSEQMRFTSHKLTHQPPGRKHRRSLRCGLRGWWYKSVACSRASDHTLLAKLEVAGQAQCWQS